MCDQICRNFAILANFTSLWQFLRIRLVFWQNLESILAVFITIGQIFIVVNGQLLKNDKAIWSQADHSGPIKPFCNK